MIGGALARPCISYPTIFSPGTIWEKYPYLLPNLFSAVAVCCGLVVGILFLEETHAGKKSRRDAGVELGKSITNWLSTARCEGRSGKAEKQPLLEDFDEQLPAYRSTESSPKLTSSPGTDSPEPLDLECQEPIPESAKPQKTFTKPVILNIVSYGILAL